MSLFVFARLMFGCLFIICFSGCGLVAPQNPSWLPFRDNTHGRGDWSIAAGDPTVTRRVVRTERNGKVEIEDASVRKDGIEVFSCAKVFSRKSTVRVYWAYYGKRHIALCESDNDGDGFYENVTLYDGDMNVVGAFVREINGDVRPFTKAQENEIVESGRTIAPASIEKRDSGPLHPANTQSPDLRR